MRASRLPSEKDRQMPQVDPQAWAAELTDFSGKLLAAAQAFPPGVAERVRAATGGLHAAVARLREAGAFQPDAADETVPSDDDLKGFHEVFGRRRGRRTGRGRRSPSPNASSASRGRSRSGGEEEEDCA